MIPKAEAWFRAKVHNPRTLARLLAANEHIAEGDSIRGHWRPQQAWRWRCMARDALRKGQFIRAFGHRVWAMLPPAAVLRDGRRQAAYRSMGVHLAGVPAGREAEAAALLRIEHPAPRMRCYPAGHAEAWARIMGR